MSVDAPTRANTSRCSKIGVTSRSYPKRCATAAKSARNRDHRRDSGGRTSRVPVGARKTSDMPPMLTAPVPPTGVLCAPLGRVGNFLEVPGLDGEVAARRRTPVHAGNLDLGEHQRELLVDADRPGVHRAAEVLLV